MKCPECNTENPSDSKYCKECAGPLPSPEEISVAHTETLKTSKFLEFSSYQKHRPQTEAVYLDILRKMKGEKKLKTAFELYEIALNLCTQNILEQNPGITDKELKKMLFKRFGYDTGRSSGKSNR